MRAAGGTTSRTRPSHRTPILCPLRLLIGRVAATAPTRIWSSSLGSSPSEGRSLLTRSSQTLPPLHEPCEGAGLLSAVSTIGGLLVRGRPQALFGGWVVRFTGDPPKEKRYRVHLHVALSRVFGEISTFVNQCPIRHHVNRHRCSIVSNVKTFAKRIFLDVERCCLDGT